MKIDKPGIYRGIESADYFADPCPEPSLSQSIGKLIVERSAAHVLSRHPRLCPPPSEGEDEAEKYLKAQAIGNTAHKIMIGRGKEVVRIEFDSFRKDDAKELRDQANAAGHVPILAKHFDIATEMVAEAWAQLKLHEDRDAFTNGSGEVMIAWQENGIWFRSLVDWLSDDLRTVDDYKTTAMSVAPHLLGYRAEAGGWHIQAAFIERGLDVLDPAGAGRRRFRWIPQEQDRPYALNVMHIDKYWRTMGHKIVDAAVARWEPAVRTDRWPGYPRHGITPPYPTYKEKQWLERELDGEFEPDPKLIMAG